MVNNRAFNNSRAWQSHGFRAHSYDRNGKQYQRRHQLQEWQSRRSSFFSIFVSNLSLRVPKEALRDIFSSFGAVRDVYIQQHYKGQRTYAFIRYQSALEMRRAIRFGNRRRIDGITVYVKEALGVQFREGPLGPGNSFYSRPHLIKRGSLRDGRLYREVVRPAGDQSSNDLKLRGSVEADRASAGVPEPRDEMVPNSLEEVQLKVQLLPTLLDELSRQLSTGPRDNKTQVEEDLTFLEQLGDDGNGGKVKPLGASGGSRVNAERDSDTCIEASRRSNAGTVY